MGKKTNILIAAAAVAAAMAAVNRSVYRRAERRRPSGGKTYRWRYGNISYTVSGRGTPVLLVHSPVMGADRTEWRRKAESLSKSHRVYAIDLLGYGMSDKPGITYSSYLYSSLLNDFVREVIREKTAAVGANETASILLAAQALDRNAYSGLVLINPAGIGTPSKQYPLLRNILNMPFLGTAFYSLLCSKMGVWLFYKKVCGIRDKDITDEMVDARHLSAHMGGVNGRLPVIAHLAGYFDVDSEGLLKKATVPVKIVKR